MYTRIVFSIAVLFVLMSVGFLARKYGAFREKDNDVISRLVVDLTTPALILSALFTPATEGIIKGAAFMPLMGMGAILVGLAVGYATAPWTGLDAGTRRTYIFLSAVSNFSYMPLPLAYILFGDKGIVMLFLTNLGSYMMLWTVCVGLLKRESLSLVSLGNVVNPPLVALVLGVSIALSPLNGRLPGFLLEALHMLGKATVPLVMLSLGSLLAGLDFRFVKLKRSFIILSAGRLLLTPFVVLTLMHLLHVPPFLRNIVLLISVMPAASSAPMIVMRFGGDEEYAAAGVFFTTMLSIITVPLLLTALLR